MNGLLRASLGTVLAASVAGSAHAADPVKIPIHNWSSQIVGAQIVGKILNEAGFETEFISSDSQVVYTSMCEGDIHLVHEVWQGAFGVAFEKVVNEGCVIDAATHDAKTREEWWVSEVRRGAVPGGCGLGGAQQVRRNVRDPREQAEGTLPRRSRGLVEA